MFTKAVFTVAALSVVSLWYLRSRAPSLPAGTGRRRDGRLAPAAMAQESPNAAEQLQHSHAMGVAGGIEMPVAQDADGSPTEGDAQWPATREFLRGG
jgi:hypothetical protein